MKTVVAVVALLALFAVAVAIKQSGAISSHPAGNVRVGMSEQSALSTAGKPWHTTKATPATIYHYREGQFVWSVWVKDGQVYDVRKSLAQDSPLQEVARELR